MDLQQLRHGAMHHFSHTVCLRVVGRGKLQGGAMHLHQFLPELCHEPLVLVHHNRKRHPVLADNMVEEDIVKSVHIHTLQQDQHYHLTKAVHDHHDGVVAAVFRQVCDEVDVDLLPRGL